MLPYESGTASRIADDLTCHQGSVIDPQKSHPSANGQLRRPIHVTKIAVEASPAELSIRAAITQGAIDDEGDDPRTPIDDDAHMLIQIVTLAPLVATTVVLPELTCTGASVSPSELVE